jgi:hypothetical protein
VPHLYTFDLLTVRAGRHPALLWTPTPVAANEPPRSSLAPEISLESRSVDAILAALAPFSTFFLPL